MASFHSLKFEKNIRLPVVILKHWPSYWSFSDSEYLFSSHLSKLWHTQRVLGYLKMNVRYFYRFSLSGYSCSGRNNWAIIEKLHYKWPLVSINLTPVGHNHGGHWFEQSLWHHVKPKNTPHDWLKRLALLFLSNQKWHQNQLWLTYTRFPALCLFGVL